jgi:hypothetical protein
MNEETLASVLSGVVRRRAPHEARDLTCAIAICDECGRAQAKGRRKAVGLAALKMYTSEYPCVYVELNAAMRNNDAAAIEPYGRYVRTMVEAMLVSPRFEESTVYRGIKLDMRAACKKGSTLVWPEFASCTSSIRCYVGFKLVSLTASAKEVSPGNGLTQTIQASLIAVNGSTSTKSSNTRRGWLVAVLRSNTPRRNTASCCS